jgi:hypothetical protein
MKWFLNEYGDIVIPAAIFFAFVSLALIAVLVEKLIEQGCI